MVYMNKILGYGSKDIPYINRLKKRIFYALTIITILLNVFMALTFNLKKSIDNSLFNSFIIVDLQNNLKENTRNEIENYTLSIKGVLAVRFMDKRESFKKLQDELNISIPESSNPLSDSLIVYLNKTASSDSIQENLEAREEVKEVYKDSIFLEKEENKGLIYSIVQIASIVIAILLGFIAIIFFNLNVAIDFLNSINIEDDYKKIIRLSKIRNLLSFTSSTTLGTLIFFNIYAYFRKYLFQVNNSTIILSLWQIFLYHLIFIVFLNFLVWVLPATIFKINGGKNEKI